ncbi:energy-coupled thiamine transporter ThiT [Lapidilactobacillus gannanensis]|jgi:thiamine transporter|uniref:Energy-coupled thiamine transporter ThiT n=1 Tax=Lapidilactobacillus gannanensis TaxID=2486002 RepID=A0ABW4BQY4_9LACO|nr:energy-coupled thiamine transporter ThiT [Lapidilactobacillus gannanensis]MCH4056765.1 energy-coupled thiamine transporter ThiT [Lactobacillaceae bacterium]
MHENERLQVMVEGAIFAGLAMALEYVPHDLGVSSVQFAYGLIPLGIYSLRRGPIPGMMAGLVWGLLDMWLRGSGSLFNPLQIILDYPLPFALAGLIGIFHRQVKTALQANRWSLALGWITVGFLIGDLAKYTAHYFSGVFFWGQYAPKGQSAWLYSLVINGGSFIANAVLGVIVFALIVRLLPNLLTRHLSV